MDFQSIRLPNDFPLNVEFCTHFYNTTANFKSIM